MIKFYGYKRCSTSKKAQKWLDDHGVKYEFQDLVEEPPKKEDLIKWMTKYQDRGLRYFFNTSGQHYRQQKLKDKIPGFPVTVPPFTSIPTFPAEILASLKFTLPPFISNAIP